MAWRLCCVGVAVFGCWRGGCAWARCCVASPGVASRGHADEAVAWARWCFAPRGVGWDGLAATDFPASWDAVSWALAVFTSEFGMGSGVGPPPWPPGRLSQPHAMLAHWRAHAMLPHWRPRDVFVVARGVRVWCVCGVVVCAAWGHGAVGGCCAWRACPGRCPGRLVRGGTSRSGD